MRTPVAFALLIALFSDAKSGHLPRPEEQIRIRQGSEMFLAWNMNRIGDMVGERSQNFNKEAVVKAAQAVAAVANAGVGSLYGPGSEKSVGDSKTRVKPEFFQQPEKVRELTASFASQANELAKAAEGGDPAAIRQQLALTNGICKSCHESFRS